jgi:cysteine desulfurase
VRHYLDHASTSPPRTGVVDAMVEWMGRVADPGRVHTEGRMVRAAIEDARSEVAALVGCRPREVVFTSGATEAVNAAVWGATSGAGGAVACAAVEHSSVRDASARGGNMAVIAVDRSGVVDTECVRSLVGGPAAGAPVLVHSQWGNHQVASLQPVAAVVEACREAGVLVHVDAAAAAGQVPVDFAALGADLLSVSGHKFGGPPGVGALIVRRGLRLAPLLVGGEQERARRAGMENVPAIVGLGVAAAAAGAALAAGGEARARAESAAIRAAALSVPGVVAYGAAPGPASTLPHIVCVGVDGVEAEAVLLGLDQAGIAAHSGSACSSESLEPSPVLQAMGVEAEHSLRLSVGWSTTEGDVDAFGAAFVGVVERLRALGA